VAVDVVQQLIGRKRRRVRTATRGTRLPRRTTSTRRTSAWQPPATRRPRTALPTVCVEHPCPTGTSGWPYACTAARAAGPSSHPVSTTALNFSLPETG